MEELVRLAQAGDRKAMERLVEHYEEPIRLYAARLVSGHAAAKDVAQESFLTALKNLNKFDPTRDFGLWVRGIVRNMARREWQRLSRNKAKMEDLTSHIELLAEEARHEDEAQAEHIAALKHCIGKLPEKSSRLLQLIYELGCSHAEVAKQVHSSLSAVKQAISRVRHKLRECVENELGEMEPYGQ